MPESKEVAPIHIKPRFNTNLRARFREGRVAADWSARALAFEVGMTAQAMSQFELGKQRLDLENFMLACEVMGLNVCWVLKGAGSMFDEGGPIKQENRAPRTKPARRKKAILVPPKPKPEV